MTVRMMTSIWEAQNGLKTKVVALQCSFQILFESSSKVLWLLRYEVKDFSHCCICFGFLHFSP
jgi:hypothetical protein